MKPFELQVLGLSLKGQRMVIALGVQDFVDRKAASRLIQGSESRVFIGFRA